jgi:exosortase
LQVEYAPAIGTTVVLTSMVLFLAGQVYRQGLENYDYLSLCTSGFVLWLIGGFVGFFGKTAIRKAMFPLLFLFFAVPVPAAVLDHSTIFLQQMSAGAVDAIFSMIGLPYLRYGTVFELPEVTIEVAEQCSGIRSSLALLVATTAAGYVFLETGWRRLIAVLAIIPITIFKNALRITALTLMASCVDPTWLTDSWLHRAGGRPFFFIALLLWSPILWLLWRSEKKGPTALNKRFKKQGKR